MHVQTLNFTLKYRKLRIEAGEVTIVLCYLVRVHASGDLILVTTVQPLASMDPNLYEQLYLLYGVQNVNASKQEPSKLTIEKKAFEIARSSKNLIVVAAAHLSEGKIVAVAHEDFINRQHSENDDSDVLMRNIFRWFTSGSKSKSPTIGLLVYGFENLITNLQAFSFSIKQIAPTEGDLSAVDAVFTTCYVQYTDKQLAAIQQFVTNGGGLLVGGHNWKSRTDFANKILFECGITITDSYGGGYEIYSLPNPEYQPRLFMLHNVRKIDSSGQKSSALTVTGNSFGVLWSKSNNCIIAAAPFSQGKIVEIGHEDYVKRKFQEGSTDEAYLMIRNIIHWLSNSKKAAVVGVIPPTGYDDFCINMSLAGYTVKMIQPTQSDLETVNVVLAECYTKFSQEQSSAIHSFITGGGGLLLCGHNWSKKTDYANDLLYDCGITITTSNAITQNIKNSGGVQFVHFWRIARSSWETTWKC